MRATYMSGAEVGVNHMIDRALVGKSSALKSGLGEVGFQLPMEGSGLGLIMQMMESMILRSDGRE